jgi:outer membrane lipoprotein carrier protein
MKFIRSLALALVSLGTVILTSASAHAEPLTPAARTELLERMKALQEKYPFLEASFSEKRTSKLLKKPITSTGTLAFQSPNKFRREVIGSNPSLTVSNGQKLWIYYPNFQQVEEYTLGQRAMFDDAMAALTAGLNFGRVESFFNLQAATEGAGYEVSLAPKRNNPVVRQLTVSLDSELRVTRTVLTLPKGDQVVTTYSNQKRGGVLPAKFEFEIPAGAQVTKPLGK